MTIREKIALLERSLDFDPSLPRSRTSPTRTRRHSPSATRTAPAA